MITIQSMVRQEPWYTDILDDSKLKKGKERDNDQDREEAVKIVERAREER